MKKIKIVAHRGYAGRYPENTMAAMQAAVDLGIKYLELDVQMTSDHVPIVLHDETLSRTVGVDGNVLGLNWSEISSMGAGEVERLGEDFADEGIPTLEQFVSWLSTQDGVHTFVEIKDESLDRFGYDAMFEKIVPICEKAKGQITLIGYDLSFLMAARARGFERVGWVLTSFDLLEKERAMQYMPDYIICNYKKVDTELWEGPWQWMFYEITNASLAEDCAEKGVTFIETMELEQLMSGLQPEDWQD